MNKKGVIIYFSGTNNSLFLSNLIKVGLEKEDKIKLDLISIESRDNINLTPYEVVIFVYPIYAFNMPKIMEKFIDKIDFINNKKYYILKDSGEPSFLNNDSSHNLIKKLKKNNIKINGEYHFLLPYNIMFRYDDNFVKELYLYNLKLLDIFIYEYKNDIKRILYSSLFTRFNRQIFKIQRWGAKINSYFYKIDKNKCNNCYLCINKCPTKNIEVIHNKIKFNHDCIMCMRCSFNCPQNAIKIGLLNHLKVNGSYNYDKIINDKNLKGDYLVSKHTHFFRLFKRKIKETNLIYETYYGKDKNKNK